MDQKKFKRYKSFAVCFLLLFALLIGGIRYKTQKQENLEIQFYPAEERILPQTVNSSAERGLSSAENAAEKTDTNSAAGNLSPSNSPDSGASYTPEEAWTININTASSEELQKLYGIGPALAERIIQYRDSYGSYETIEEIMEVNGIGEVTYEKIKEWIRVQNN